MVSILSTIAKSCVLTAVASAMGQYRWLRLSSRRPRRLQELQGFDEASRGPLGSLKLLYHVRLRSLAVVGCICTIATLGFDTFIQQLIHTGTRTVFSNDASASLEKIATIADPGKLRDVRPVAALSD